MDPAPWAAFESAGANPYELDKPKQQPTHHMSAHGDAPGQGDYHLPTLLTRTTPEEEDAGGALPGAHTAATKQGGPPQGVGVRATAPPVAKPVAAPPAPTVAPPAPAAFTTAALLDPSLATGLFALYLLIGANFLGKLLGCRVQTLLATNMPLTHAMGFATLLFFVTLTGPGKGATFAATAAAAAGLYAWFLATARMTEGAWAVMILCLGAAFVAGAYIEATYKTPEERKAALPTALAKVQAVLVGGAATATAVGTLLYFGEKRVEYADQFRLDAFVFGKPHCRQASPAVPVGTALRAAFGL